MLELLVLIALVLCLTRFLTCVKLVKGKYVYGVSVLIGIAISFAYSGDNLQSAMVSGLLSGLSVDALYFFERLQQKNKTPSSLSRKEAKEL